jgi:hypothetical protein
MQNPAARAIEVSAARREPHVDEPSAHRVMRELAALKEPKMREANERRGDDHGVRRFAAMRRREVERSAPKRGR